jgi:hypothetical protein
MTRALGSDRVNESEIERANLFCATRQGGVTDLTRTCPAHIARAARMACARKQQRVSSLQGGNMKYRHISSSNTARHSHQYRFSLTLFFPHSFHPARAKLGFIQRPAG